MDFVHSITQIKTQIAICSFNLKRLFRGFLVAAMVAATAEFLSSRYDVPVMLMALLLGMSLHFLVEEKSATCTAGIEFISSTILRVGIALLGARVTMDVITLLSTDLIMLIILCVILTIIFGVIGSYLLKRGWRLGVLTGGAVAICGASAAMAIAAVLPKNQHSDQNVIFTVVSVTVLSTIAMILYPVLTEALVFDQTKAGIFLGATIHDVAQVIGAGFSVSDESGKIATVVKLIRVAMLAPVVLILALIVRNFMATQNNEGARPPILPFFILSFMILALANSFHMIPNLALDMMASASRWALILAIAAVGVKTTLKQIVDVGGQAILLIISETVFIALMFHIGLSLIEN